MEMAFTTMSLRQGETMKREGFNAAAEFRIINFRNDNFLVSFRVRLSKRRAKAGTQSTTNAVLVCKHRDMNEKELEAQVSVANTALFPETMCVLCSSDRFAPFAVS